MCCKGWHEEAAGGVAGRRSGRSVCPCPVLGSMGDVSTRKKRVSCRMGTSRRVCGVGRSLSDSSSCGGCVVLLGSLDAFPGRLVGGGRMEQAGGAENVKRLLLVGGLLVGQGAEAQEAVPVGLVRTYADSTAARLELIANLIDATGDPKADPVSRAMRSRRDSERISQALDEAIEYSYAAVFAAGALCGGSGILRYATLYLGIGSAIIAVRSWPFYPDDRSGFAEILRRQAEDNRRGGRAVERDCAGRGGNKEH